MTNNFGTKFKKKCPWLKSMNTLRCLRTYTHLRFDCFRLQNMNRTISEYRRDDNLFRLILCCLRLDKRSKPIIRSIGSVPRNTLSNLYDHIKPSLNLQ